MQTGHVDIEEFRCGRKGERHTNIYYCLEHGKGSELLDNQQRALRDDAKMLSNGELLGHSPILHIFENYHALLVLFTCRKISYDQQHVNLRTARVFFF